MDELSNFQKEFKATFGGAARAISEQEDVDVFVVPKFYEVNEDGSVRMNLYVDGLKDFAFDKASIDTNDDGNWIIEGDNDRWLLRPIEDEPAKKRYIQQMKEQGIRG